MYINQIVPTIGRIRHTSRQSRRGIEKKEGIRKTCIVVKDRIPYVDVSNVLLHTSRFIE